MGFARLKLYAEKKKVILDPVSLICILGAFMFFGLDMFLFLPDIENAEALKIVLRSSISFTFLVAGLIGMIFSGVHTPKSEKVGGNIDPRLSPAEMGLISMLFMINMMAIVAINILTRQHSDLGQKSFVNYPQSNFRWAIFSTAVGWTEEVVFRGFMQTTMSRVSGGVVGVLASSFAWVLFHGGVYNLDPTIYLTLFLIGLVLSITYEISQYRLSVTMLPHGLNNFLATIQFGGAK